MRSTSEMLIHSRETIGDVPPELIGASTALAGSKLYLFGGSLASAPDPKPLSDLYVLDLDLWKWEVILPATEDSIGPRYFHTIEIWQNHLVVFGGLGTQGDSEQLQVLSDVRMFNLSTRRWLRPPRVPAVCSSTSVPRPRHAHVSCVSHNHLFVIGGKGFFGEALDDLCAYDLGKKEWIHRQFSTMPRLDTNHSFVATSQWHVRTPTLDPPLPERTENIVQSTPLSYSDSATNKSPCDIYLYNADHLQRKLEMLSPLPDGAIQTKKQPPGAIGSNLPFLRFPSGVILGKTLIVAGNHPAGTGENAFIIWTLDLETNVWVSIDTGELLKNGSWAKGFLWHEQNKFLAFGKHGGSFVDTADRLVLGWDAVAVVDLETLGIYQPPPLKLDATNQRLGLTLLAEGKKADFDFLCEDGRRIPCSRKLILDRWPWFREQYARLSGADASIKHQKRTEITITQASATLAQSYPVNMALLQYFYSLALGTALQRAPAVLSYLLLISTEFQIPHLRALVRHAMHLALTETTAEGVYEIAASCGCRSLQIRAFRIHAESKDRAKARIASPTSQKIGRARSNSEGSRPRMPDKRSGTGFPSSPFSRPLRSNNHTATNDRTITPLPPQVIPPLPRIPSSIPVGRASDPGPTYPRPREASPLKKQLQQEPHAVRVAASKNNHHLTEKASPPTQTPVVNDNDMQRKRSQSVGSRIPRAPSRLATASLPRPPSRSTTEAYPPDVGGKAKTAAATATRIPTKAPSTPVTGNNAATITPSKGARRFRWRATENAGKLQEPVDGIQQQQSRGRKVPATVVAAVSKGGENKRSK